MSTTFPANVPPSARPPVASTWPMTTDASHEFEPSVGLEIDDATIRLVRELRCDGAAVVRMVAWSATYADPSLAIDAYEALAHHEDRLTYWSVGATALGADWLNPTISMLVEDYLIQRAEDRVTAAREADEARRVAEKELAAATKIDLYYLVRKKMFCLTLDRGDEEFWSIKFQEKWERDRFGDWMQRQKHRFADFADYMTEGDRFELERKLLREMLVTEQAVKKQGLSAGGRRPLRFWRGEA